MAWRTRIALVLFMPCGLFSFEKMPWFYPPFEMQFKTHYRFEYFSSVERGFNPIDYHSNNNFFGLGLLVPVFNNWDIEAEIEFDQTSKLHFDFLSGGASLRKQIYSDVAGDLFSLAVGANFRIVPHERLVDVATPYHHVINGEFSGSIGKEFSNNNSWYARAFGYAAFGIAETGSPWIRALLEGTAKFDRRFLFRGFLDGYFGLGNETWVNVNNFDSYAKIAHRSIDLGLSYAYLFKVYGELRLSYSYRIYAHAYPQYANNVEVRYRLPFSF